MSRSETVSVPISKRWLVDGFCWYSTGLIRKQFQSMGFLGLENITDIPKDQSVVVYANHASWWDPIVAMLCRREYMKDRTLYAPIDAEQLENYAVLKKMGFYGVQLQTFSGAQSFLETSKAILNHPFASIWITPEGRFCDVRDQSQSLMPGLAHLATRVETTSFVPLALEYPFWDDSRPHIFGAFGKPLSRANVSCSDKQSWNLELTNALRETQSILAEQVIKRDPKAFRYLIASRAKRLGVYDVARRWAAWLRGRDFDPRHSETMKR
jgi:1-acyl-sn-glycerol-3-phosphate acyltransferase